MGATDAIRYDPFSLETQEDPYPAYRALLERVPVYRNEERDFWALSRFADVQAAFRDWKELSSAGGVTVDELLALTGPSILTMDPPRHDELRAIVRDAFRPKAIAALEARVRRCATELLGSLGGPGEPVDLVAAVARRLPVQVVCDLLGLPAGDELALRRWSAALLERAPGEDRTPDAALRAATAMRAYFEEHIADRRSRGRGDLVSALVDARPGGAPLPHEEIVGMCFLLFEAGNTTTAALIASSLLLLAEHPEQRSSLLVNPGGVERAIEEVLRFEAPVQNMGRVAASDLSVHSETIPAGSRVLLLIGAANRDPRVWADPDRFDVSREPKRTLAFGEGIHHCLGAPLARLEARVLLETLLGRFPRYEIVEFRRFHDVTQRNLKTLVAQLG